MCECVRVGGGKHGEGRGVGGWERPNLSDLTAPLNSPPNALVN